MRRGESAALGHFSVPIFFWASRQQRIKKQIQGDRNLVPNLGHLFLKHLRGYFRKKKNKVSKKIRKLIRTPEY